MVQDLTEQTPIKVQEIEGLMEMEMEESNPLHDKYGEVSSRVDQLMKNLVLNKISNKRNELNILYLFQRLNNKKVNSENFENVFKDLDKIFEDINKHNYKFEELISKNNELGKQINPLIKDLLK